MKVIAKVYGVLMAIRSGVQLAVPLLVGVIRYIVCRELQCAISYFVTAALIVFIVYTVLKIVGKRLLPSEPARGDDEEIEKSEKEV